MVKTIIKETGIIVLLLVAVALLLAIVFYDYIPNNKAVPVKIQAYDIPEDIKQELNNSLSTEEEEQNIVRTYFIDSSDLDLYESTNDYDKGKANPFADYTETKTQNTTTQSNNTNNGGVNSASNQTNNNTTFSGNLNTVNNTQQNIDAGEVYMNTPGKNY